MSQIAVVDADLCTGCGACVDECDDDALHMNDDETLAVVTAANCTGCASCVDVCPTAAIEMQDA
jgi:NAD-dependent dihydropyrimidine dehydrogenase PreA subunit